MERYAVVNESDRVVQSKGALRPGKYVHACYMDNAQRMASSDHKGFGLTRGFRGLTSDAISSDHVYALLCFVRVAERENEMTRGRFRDDRNL